jgi:hypothetical protein
MRKLLGIVSGLFLLPLVLGTVWASIFASGWEGGHGGGRSAWNTFLSLAPVAYLLYCFACAVFGITGRALLVSGITALLVLAAFIGGYSQARTLGPDDKLVWIGGLSFLALIWFGYYRSVTVTQHQQ